MPNPHPSNDNTKYLIPFNKLPHEEVVRLGSKGGKAAAKAFRKKQELRKCMQALLDGEYEFEGKKLSGAELATTKLFETFLNKGDARTFEVLRDTAGQKPVDKVVVDSAVTIENPYGGLTTKELKKLARKSD